MANEREILLKVRDLEVAFGSGRNKFKAVRGVSFDVYKGETFGIVGESGSGKTTIGRSIIRVYPASGGSIKFHDKELTGRISKQLDREITNKIQMIFQDPMASLNERAKIDYIVSEGLQGRGYTKQEISEKVTQLRSDTAGYTEQVFKMYGGPTTDIVLEFQDNLLGAVYDKFGENINIMSSGERTCIAAVKVQVSPVFWGWLFQFAGEMKIISPSELIEEQKKLAQNLLN